MFWKKKKPPVEDQKVAQKVRETKELIDRLNENMLDVHKAGFILWNHGGKPAKLELLTYREFRIRLAKDV